MSHLAEVAQTLGAGQWAMLNLPGDGSNYGANVWPVAAAGAVFQSSHNFVYDHGTNTGTQFQPGTAGRRRIFFKGGAQLATGSGPTVNYIGQFVYDIDANLWTRLPVSQFDQDMFGAAPAGSVNPHSYGNNCFIPQTRQWVHMLNNGNGQSVIVDCDVVDLSTINSTTSWNYPTLFTPAGAHETLGATFGAICFFPDANCLVWISVETGWLYIKPLGQFAWLPIVQLTPFISAGGVTVRYNHSLKCCIVAGASNVATYKIAVDANRTVSAAVVTRLADAPEAWSQINGRLFIDPVSGKVQVLVPQIAGGVATGIHWFEFDVSANQWSRRTDLETIPVSFATGASGLATGYDYSSAASTELWDLGVMFWAGPNGVALYKHLANNWASGISAQTFAAMQPGRVGWFPFDDPSELQLGWNATDPVLSAAVAAAGHTTNYNLNPATRNLGEGNAQAPWGTTGFSQFPGVAPTFPEIDNTIFDTRSASTGGALRVSLPPNFTGDAGQVLVNLDGKLGYNDPWGNCYFSPTSPFGRFLYVQWSQRRSRSIIDTSWRNYDPPGWNSPWSALTTPAAGSLVLNSNPVSDAPFLPEYVGRLMIITVGTNFQIGFYPITAYVSSSEIHLANSPTPNGPGAGGVGYMGGDPNVFVWNRSLSCAQGSTTLVLNNPGQRPFDPVLAGGTINIFDSSIAYNDVIGAGTGFVGGIYNIVSVIDGTHMVLSTSPCPNQAGSNGFGRIGNYQLGQKLVVLTGNAPYGFYAVSLGGDGGVIQCNAQLDAVNYYIHPPANRTGTDGPVNQAVVQTPPDIFQTITIRREINGYYRFHTANANDTIIVADPIPQLFDKFYPLMNPAGPFGPTYLVCVTGSHSGRVSRLSLIAGGSGYLTATNVAATGGTGQGLLINLTVVGGVIQSVAIVNPGFNYQRLQVLNIPGGTGGQVQISFVDLYDVVQYIDPTHIELAVSPTPEQAESDLIASEPMQRSGRVTVWVDGVQAIDWPYDWTEWWPANDPIWTAFAGFANPYGIGCGQIEITGYMTRKDPTFANPQGFMWWDNLMVSSVPPVMQLGLAEAPPPPPPVATMKMPIFLLRKTQGVPPPPPPANNVLAQTAATLAPGSWAVLNVMGDSSGYGTTVPTFPGSTFGTIFGFASKAAYDTERQRIYYLGGPHGQPIAPDDLVFCSYDVRTNLWHRLTNPTWAIDYVMGSNMHGYQLQSSAPGKFFRAPAGSYDVYECDVAQDDFAVIGPDPSWSMWNPAVAGGIGNTSRGCVEYFKDRDTLLFLDSAAGVVYEAPLQTQQWSNIFTHPNLTPNDGLAMTYNPIKKAVVFGGGSTGMYMNTFWKIDVNGIVTAIDPVPDGPTGVSGPTRSYAHGATLFSYDPTSGKWLLIRNYDFYNFGVKYGFFDLDIEAPAGSQWQERTDLAPAIPVLDELRVRSTDGLNVFATVIIAIPEYGVNVLMCAETVYVYKHQTAARRKRG